GAQRLAVARKLIDTHGAEIDLDHADERQQRFDAFQIAAVVVQRQPETALAQLAATVDQRFVDLRGFENLEHDLLGRQQFQQFTRQKTRIDVEEALQAAKHLLYAQFG